MAETEVPCETEQYFERLNAERKVILSAHTTGSDRAAIVTKELVTRYVDLMARKDAGPNAIQELRKDEHPISVHGLWLLNAEARYACLVLKNYDRSTEQICSILNMVLNKFPTGITDSEPESNSLLLVLLLNLARIQREAGKLLSAKQRSTQLANFIKLESHHFHLSAFPSAVSSEAHEIAAWCDRNLSEPSRRFVLRKLDQFDQTLAHKQHE